MPHPSVVPEGLQTIIDVHRGLFGGFVMQADGPDPAAGDGQADSDNGGKADGLAVTVQPKTDQPGKAKADAVEPSESDKPLGPAGERALASVRDENRQLRADLASFKKALGDAFGIDPADKKADPLATIQQEVAALRRENTVQRVARTHGIVDDADIALLMKAGDGDYVAELAARLKPTVAPPSDGLSGPVPDPTPTGRVAPHIGKTNGDGRAGSVSQAAENYLSRSKKK